jgi:hypothetical protein
LTKQEFVQRNRHEIAGMVLDALSGGKGPELSMRIRYTVARIDQLLGEMYEQLLPGVPANNPTSRAGGRNSSVKE